MGYFQVRYDSRVVNYDRRGFIRLATDVYFTKKNIGELMTSKTGLCLFELKQLAQLAERLLSKSDIFGSNLLVVNI